MTLEEIMTENPIWVNPTTTASAAARQMLRSNVGGLPVCSEGGRLCGFITDRDLALRCLAAEEPGGTAVGKLMTRQVVSATPDWEVHSARRLMVERNLHRLPVTVDGKLVGVVTLADIVASEGGAY